MLSRDLGSQNPLPRTWIHWLVSDSACQTDPSTAPAASDGSILNSECVSRSSQLGVRLHAQESTGAPFFFWRFPSRLTRYVLPAPVSSATCTATVCRAVTGPPSRMSCTHSRKTPGSRSARRVVVLVGAPRNDLIDSRLRMEDLSSWEGLRVMVTESSTV